MGEVSDRSSGLLSKISSLFNSPLFSDVEFVFIDKNTGQNQKIYGHKLILALGSKAFAYEFFEKKESTKLIKLPASKKTSFELLFRFLYTDDVQIRTFDEAQELLNLASTYDIKELGEKCLQYILKDRLTIKNIFSKYECALKENVKILLKDCRDFVCTNSQQVLLSENFTNASSEVIEDIIKQDNLSLSSELEIITAVLSWGKEDLKRKKMPSDEKYLRDCINNFMKYLRFLTLSSSEFDYFVEHYNILSAKESFLITRKILQPDCNVNLPKEICSVAAKRKKNCLGNNSPILYQSSANPKYTRANSQRSLISESPEFVVFESPKFSDYQPTNKISFEVKKCSPYKEPKLLMPQLKQTKFSIPTKKNFPFPKYLQSSSPMREYSFSLSDIQPCIELSFNKDIICSIIFMMKVGNISFHGFDLRIKNQNNSTDELEVSVDMNGFSEQPFSHHYKKKLCNNIFSVKFSKAMILKEGNKGELEIEIDSLLLNRCSACRNIDGHELNIGLDFAIEFYLKSNQKYNGLLFVIDKLYYTLF